MTKSMAKALADDVEFEPAEPRYAPSLPLEEQLRLDEPSGLAELAGQGTFVDNGTDRWHWMVVDGRPGILTLQLQVPSEITWYKNIHIAASFFGSWYKIRELMTKGENTVSAVDLTQQDAQSGTLKLDFWRCGFLGFGAYVTTMLLDVPTHIGKRVIFLCDRPLDP